LSSFSYCERIAVLKVAARAAAVIVMLMGGLVLVGWQCDIELLKAIVPGLSPMNPTSAVGFILAGMALGLLISAPPAAPARRWAQVAAAAVALIGLLRLLAVVTSWDVGVDQGLFHSQMGVARSMSAQTALNFAVLGGALLLLDVPTRRKRWPAEFLALLVALVAVLGIVGYLYGVHQLVRVSQFKPISLPSALAFLVLALALMAARPERGLMAIVTTDNAGGMLARRLLPTTLLVPALLGWLWMMGERASLFTMEVGAALLVMANIVFFLALLWWNAGLLVRMDAERLGAQEALQRAHHALEKRVEERTADLAQMVLEIQAGVNILAGNTREILAATTQLTSAAMETATAVTETTATVEEVRQTAQLSSQKAEAVSVSAQKAAQVSLAGTKATDEAAAGMQRIRQQMESIADSMVRLSEQTQAIGQIIASVDDLAAQSNLLAVNAAIEAAKAGEQGKGFAVVAQEVKSLAEQSKQATNQVRTILHDIQKATSAAVMATEQGGKAVETGVKQSTQAGESILALTGGVTEAAHAATQIAASSRQQLLGIEQVATAMESIKQSSAQNVASAKQLETSALNLNALGQKLRALTAKQQEEAGAVR
jgi:methyl-accepting chemotaxis protein